MRRSKVVLACLFVAGCGGGSGPAAPARTGARPAPAPSVTLSAEDRHVWAPGPARPGIPVLLYHGIGDAAAFTDPADAGYAVAAPDFAKQMALLRYAGYHTVTLAQFSAYVAGRRETLPSRPLLLTFDDGLASSWLDGDGALAREGFTAVMFVDAGRVGAGTPGYLSWAQLRSMRASGRWEVQLHAWQGHRYVRYAREGFGAFYAFRDKGESLAGWRRRVFGDIEQGLRVLGRELPGEPEQAFAPPYGNYGQEATNDPEIPRELLRWLLARFSIVFVQDRSARAHAHSRQPLGRIQLSRSTTGGELHTELLR